MLYKVVKWTAWAVTVVALLVFGGSCLTLYYGMDNTVYITPFGIVDTDTLQIGLLTSGEKKACYVVYREIKRQDTLTYYLQPDMMRYYVVMRDSTGELQVWEWDRYNKCPAFNVTRQFKERDIIIR